MSSAVLMLIDRQVGYRWWMWVGTWRLHCWEGSNNRNKGKREKTAHHSQCNIGRTLLSGQVNASLIL